MELSASDRALVRRELKLAQRALSAAQATEGALDALAELTVAVETLSATQHELVNSLLDRGTSWSSIADALSTSSAAAQRRYPRRASRETAQPVTDERSGPGPSAHTGV